MSTHFFLFPRNFVEVGSHDFHFFMLFSSEFVSRRIFTSVSWGYGVGGHGLESHNDFELTFTHNLTSLQVIRKLGNVD